MLILLEALLKIFIQILVGMVVPLLLTLGGLVIIIALLRLAKFDWWPRGLVTVGLIWFIRGTTGAFIYSTVIYAFPPLKGAPLMFLAMLVAGIEPLISPQLSVLVSLLWSLLLPWSPPTLSIRELIPPTNEWFRRWVLYASWVYVWLTLLIGWRYGALGMLLLTLPTFLTSLGGLFFISAFILPYPELDVKNTSATHELVPTFEQEIQEFVTLMRDPENADARREWVERRRMALRCLITYALGTNYPYYVIIDEKINERTEEIRTWLPWQEKLVKRLDGDSFGDFLAGPGVILSGCDQAVVLSTGLKFKGAKGPGIVFTEMSDSPTQVMDLRVQLRAFPVQARTKDGIAVRVFTFVPFRVGRGQEQPELGKSFPYRASDVFKAIHEQVVEHEDPSQVAENLKQYEWYDLPKIVGERAVREAISQYKFDDLYAPFELHNDPSQHPRAKIGRALQEALEQELPLMGLQRVGSGISNLEPEDPRVIEQRIEAWQADWKRKIMLQQAAGQSMRLRLIEQARAQAQIDVIVDIGKRVKALRDTSARIPMDVVALDFIDILGELAARSAAHRVLPAGDTDVIRQARKSIGI